MTTDEEAVDAFTTWMRERRGAQRGTLDKYHRLCRTWATFLSTPLTDRSAEDVEAFVARDRRGGEAAANATVVNEIAVLTSLYRWGHERLGWGENPAALAGRPKVHNRLPRAVDDDTWLTVWTHELPVDARVALGLGFYCGLRREELTTLTGSHYWGRALVNFIRKGGGEDRFDVGDVLDHWEHTKPELEAHRLEGPLTQLARQRGTDALLPWGSWVQPRAINKRMGRWLADAGLAPDAFTPHALRHSFVTNLLITGVPLHVVSQLANHSSVTTTMRYVKPAGGQLARLRTNERKAL